MTGRTGYTLVTNGMSPDGPTQMKAIYEHFDALIGETVTTASALPSSGNWKGRTVMAEDSGIVYINVDGGSTWKAWSTTAPVAFTPAWTNVGISSQTAQYTIAGGRYFVTGTSTVSGAPAAGILVATPVAFTINGQEPVRGTCKFVDVGTGATVGLVDQNATSGASAVRLLAQLVNGTYPTLANLSPTAPHAWAANDQIHYEYTGLAA